LETIEHNHVLEPGTSLVDGFKLLACITVATDIIFVVVVDITLLGFDVGIWLSGSHCAVIRTRTSKRGGEERIIHVHGHLI
jgi:hypothetical protein